MSQHSSEDSNDSTTSQCTKLSLEWIEIENGLTEDEIVNYFQNSVPKTNTTQTNQKVNCSFCDPFVPRHKLVQKYLECSVENCKVQYKWSLCKILNQGSIFMYKNHEHTVDETYENSIGLPQVVKEIIIQLVKDHPKIFPKQIRIYLNVNAEKLGIDDLAFELHQIQGFVNRLKQKSVENDNILNVELYCGDNMYFPTIDPYRPFFFGFKLDNTGKPVIGCGVDNDPTYIFATTIKLLMMNLDTSNQNHVSLFHVDGTYKLTRSKREYFIGQWINSQWSNWQLLSRPPGFSTTNNNIESVNGQIKKHFAEYLRGSIYDVCKLMCTILIDAAKSQTNFDLSLKRNNKMIKNSQKYTLDQFVLKKDQEYTYYSDNVPKYVVNIKPKFCSCAEFSENSICRHYVAIAKLNNIDFETTERRFVMIKGKGRPKKSNNGALNH